MALLPHRRPATRAVAATPTPACAREHAYRPDIDGLRAVAVGAVIVYHAFPRTLRGGFSGVDIFFVISGYLISRIVVTGLQAGTFSLGEFYRRRARRILPALLLVLAACGVFGWLTLLPTEMQWLGRSLCWCASFLANVYFARTGAGYFERAEALNPLLHLWSLGVEEQFYIVWPILLMLAVRRRGTSGLLLGVFALSLVVSIWGAWHEPRRSFYFTTSRAWELAIGGMLLVWQAHAARTTAAADSNVHIWSAAAPVCSLAGLALIVAAAVFLSASLAIPGLWSLIPTGGAALVIAAGPHAPLNRNLLGNRAMTYLGQVSYPLYLWHWPLFSFSRIFLGHPAPPVVAATLILIAFGAACATYRWVELPIRQGKSGRWAVPGLLAALAILALVGAVAWVHRFPGRLAGAPFLAWNAAVTDWHSRPDAKVDPHTGIMTFNVTGGHDRTALFIGDSHIEQYWPRVAYVVETHPDTARSAAFVIYRGCLPIPGIDSTWKDTKCRLFFDYAMRRARQPGVDTVVFGAFWEKFFIGEYAAQPVHGVPDLWPAPVKLDSPVARSAFEQFRQAVASLVSSGKRVFIVLSNPTSPRFEPLFPMMDRLSLQPPQRFAEGPRVDSGPFELFVAPLTNRLRNIAAQSGAEVVDPRSSLCDGALCPSTAPDGLPLYLDTNHLRSAYARERASFVDPMLLGGDAQ